MNPKSCSGKMRPTWPPGGPPRAGGAVEIDLAAVARLNEPEVLLREDADDLAFRRSDLRFHLAAPALRELIDLPLGGMEGVADGDVEIFRFLVGDQLGAGHDDIETHPVRAALVVVEALAFHCDAATRDAVV